jgi:5-methylcytosine-specific restriction endonuclease McrA
LFRDGSRCQYCGRDADSIDHVVPRSRGGTHAWDNVVAACRRCNLAKGNRLLGEISMTLRRPPMAPKQLSWLAVALERVPEQWKPYLGEQLLSA